MIKMGGKKKENTPPHTLWKAYKTSYLTEEFAFWESIFSNHTKKLPKFDQHYNKTVENYSACLTYQLNLLVKPYMIAQEH